MAGKGSTETYSDGHGNVTAQVIGDGHYPKSKIGPSFNLDKLIAQREQAIMDAAKDAAKESEQSGITRPKVKAKKAKEET